MISLPIRLSELTQKIQGVLKGSFQNEYYWVIADIANYSYQAQKGFHFFDLVEKEDATTSLKSKVSASAWKEGSLKIRDFENLTGQKFRNDIRILCQVSVDFHPVYGLKLTLIDLDIRFTLGELEQQRKLTLDRLLKECSSFIRLVGDRYRTRNQEIDLPKVIQNIAVISSQNSAGFEDFEHTLLHNTLGYGFNIDPYFTLVQGESNADALRKTLLEIFKSGLPYDGVFILRGGGASTDLLIFDTFILGQIVAKYPIPIITGIGHHKNETIVDLMAHTSTKTPTQAAEFVLAHNQAFEQEIIYYRQSLTIKTQQIISVENKRIQEKRTFLVAYLQTWLNSLSNSLESKRFRINSLSIALMEKNQKQLTELSSKISLLPKYILADFRSQLNYIRIPLSINALKLIQNQSSYLHHFADLVRIMNPQMILKRGFAILRKENKILTNALELTMGEKFEVELYEEKILARVNKIEKK